MTCPECGGILERVVGQVSQTYRPGTFVDVVNGVPQPLPTRLLLATFWACTGCEHCEVTGPDRSGPASGSTTPPA